MIHSGLWSQMLPKSVDEQKLVIYWLVGLSILPEVESITQLNENSKGEVRPFTVDNKRTGFAVAVSIPVVRYPSQVRWNRMTMIPDLISSYPFKQACFKRAANCRVVPNQIVWRMAYRRSLFHTICNVLCGTTGESHWSELWVQRWSFLWLF